MRVLYLSIKPSPARWSNWDSMARANELVRAWCEARPWAEFVDVAAPLLDPYGRPSEGLYLDDGLHLNAEGYARWATVVRPRVLGAWRGAGG